MRVDGILKHPVDFIKTERSNKSFAGQPGEASIAFGSKTGIVLLVRMRGKRLISYRREQIKWQWEINNVNSLEQSVPHE